MPLVVVNHDAECPDSILRGLAELLPPLVAEALDCPDERVGHLRPEDVEVRFKAYGPFDVTGGLRFVFDVEAMWFASRAETVAPRSEAIRDGLAANGITDFGVWLTLPAGAWVVG